MGTLIRFAERIRYRNAQDRPFAYWNHVALVVNPSGYLIEVLHTGVVLRNIEKYRDHDYYYIDVGLTEADRREAARYAYSCLRQKYGSLGFVLFGFSLALGDRFAVPDRGQQGCAALIVRALQRAGMKFERRPADMMPADLAKRFAATP